MDNNINSKYTISSSDVDHCTLSTNEKGETTLDIICSENKNLGNLYSKFKEQHPNMLIKQILGYRAIPHESGIAYGYTFEMVNTPYATREMLVFFKNKDQRKKLIQESFDSHISKLGIPELFQGILQKAKKTLEYDQLGISIVQLNGISVKSFTTPTISPIAEIYEYLVENRKLRVIGPCMPPKIEREYINPEKGTYRINHTHFLFFANTDDFPELKKTKQTLVSLKRWLDKDEMIEEY